MLLAAASAAAEEEPEDLLGGFDDEDESLTLEPTPERGPLGGEFWELTGSLSLAGSVNFLPHRSSVGDTSYRGLSKLRTRLNLQLDVDLPHDWELRAAGFGYYDWAYRIRGRGDYTDAVLRKYEWDADTGDVWLRGSPFEGLDVKLGRQVLAQGRSLSLRVLDIWNPLDNREPGIADIEDLRRPVAMGRFDYYRGPWRLTAVAVPEIRFHQNPVPGSDFFPAPPGPPMDPPPRVVEKKPDSFEHWETGLAATGIFQGWDVSFHFAYFYDDFATLETLTPAPGSPFVLKHHRLWLLGTGGNYTFGSWLVKGELAVVDGVGFTDASDKRRLDVLAGVEYYGFANTTIAVEALNRHVFDFPQGPAFGTTGAAAQEDAIQGAIRLTRTFFRERLEATALALLVSGDDEVGSIVRIDGTYEIREALEFTGGVVLYQESDLPPLSTYGDNDRFFFELRWSF